MPPLADLLQSLMEEHFAYRLVLELEEIELLRSVLIGELLALDKWIRARQGVMRLCGLSPYNVEVLRRLWLDNLLPVYQDRMEAVLGPHHRPSQPR
jgi:anti-anti-sigma regulatory factor